MSRQHSRFRLPAILLSSLAIAAGALTALPASPAAAALTAVPVSCNRAIPAAGSLGTLTVSPATCYGAGGRVADYSFATPNLVPNSSGFGVPKVATPKARVILPSDYFSSSKRYPVIYLLHGGGTQFSASGSTGAPSASYIDWTAGDAGIYGTTADAAGGTALTTLTSLPGTAGDGVILVMPEGGAVGLYTDWTYADTHTGSPRYESFIVGQLMPWVDSAFRTWGDQARGIAGVSMGGLGAMYYTQKYPAKFTVTASFSGTLDIQDTGYGPFSRIPVPAVYSGALALQQSGDLGDVYGKTGQNMWLGSPIYRGAGPNWVAHNPIVDSNVQRLAGEDVTVTVGAMDTSKPLTDRRHCEFTVANPADAPIAAGESTDCIVAQKFNDRVTALSVPMAHYTYVEAQGQIHNWANWNGRFQTWLPYALSKLTPAA